MLKENANVPIAHLSQGIHGHSNLQVLSYPLKQDYTETWHGDLAYGDPGTELWRPGYEAAAAKDVYVPVPVLFWLAGDCQVQRQRKTAGTTL